MMTKVVCGVFASVALFGCNAGMSPEPMSREQAKDALANLSPQAQINYYKSGPMPADQKREKIAEVEAKYGIKASDTAAPKTSGQ